MTNRELFKMPRGHCLKIKKEVSRMEEYYMKRRKKEIKKVRHSFHTVRYFCRASHLAFAITLTGI